MYNEIHICKKLVVFIYERFSWTALTLPKYEPQEIKKNSILEAEVKKFFLNRFSITHSDDFSESGSGPYGSQKYESQVGNPKPSSEVNKTLVQPFFGMIAMKLIDASICVSKQFIDYLKYSIWNNKRCLNLKKNYNNCKIVLAISCKYQRILYSNL